MSGSNKKNDDRENNKKKLIEYILELYDEYENNDNKSCSKENIENIYKLLDIKFGKQHDVDELFTKIINLLSVSEKTVSLNLESNSNNKKNELNQKIIKFKNEYDDKIPKLFSIFEETISECIEEPKKKKSIYTFNKFITIDTTALKKFKNIQQFIDDEKSVIVEGVEKCSKKKMEQKINYLSDDDDEIGNYLFIQLKLFEFNKNTNESTKLSDNNVVINAEDTIKLKNIKNKDKFVEYEKFGSIYHIGKDINSGHYITDIKTSKGIKRFNDGIVSENTSSKKNLYIIIYKKKDIPLLDIDDKGITNYGNTCFFNSLFQNLFRMPKFIEELKNIKRENKNENENENIPSENSKTTGITDPSPRSGLNPKASEFIPSGTSEEPSETSEEPSGTSEEPSGTSEEPSGTSEEPSGTSEESSGTSEESPGTSEESSGSSGKTDPSPRSRLNPEASEFIPSGTSEESPGIRNNNNRKNTKRKRKARSERIRTKKLTRTPTEEPPTEPVTPPVDTPPREAPPTETPPTEAPSTETPPAEAPPTEAPSTEPVTPPTEAPSTEPVTPPTETPPTEAPPTETPPELPPSSIEGHGILMDLFSSRIMN
jgi:ubiquitin C-terminal hydrolase